MFLIQAYIFMKYLSKLVYVLFIDSKLGFKMNKQHFFLHFFNLKKGFKCSYRK